jgi:two-component system OmpR family sensor kinase
MQERAGAAARDVDLVLDAEGGARIAGDAGMLLVLVRNLLENALRFVPDSGQVRLTLRNEGRTVLVQVDDSGPGVAPELRSRIFDRFFRGTDGRGAGSGLGLSIVRRIAEIHRGAVAASSSPTLGGLRVEVRFPAIP